jgi:hypothetical protein
MLVLSCTVTSTEITAFIFLCNPINSVHYMKNTLSAGQSTSTKCNISKRSIHNTFHERITSKRNVHARSRGFQTLTYNWPSIFYTGGKQGDLMKAA